MVGRRAESVLVALLAALALAGCGRGREDGDPPDGLPVREPLMFPWAAALVDDPPPLAARPGTTWSADLSLQVDLRQHVPAMGRFTAVLVAVFGEQRYDAAGRYRAGPSDPALTSTFTTLGLPVASRDPWPGLRTVTGKDGSPFEGVLEFPLPAGDPVAAVHRFRGRVEVPLPADLAEGWWQPRVALLVRVEGQPRPVFLAMFHEERRQSPFWSLPLVEVGRPAPPRMPWTAFPGVRAQGRAGTLPEEMRGVVELVSPSAFPADLVLPPGMHSPGPGLPVLFPAAALPEVYGPDTLVPTSVDLDLYREIEVSCRVEGPGGTQDLGTRRGSPLAWAAPDGPVLEGGPFRADLTATGDYVVHLSGHVKDRWGRAFAGGGTYRVRVALPLTFSTSCKPGTSFLVGNAYPPKVNLNPPVPADVEVSVRFLPNSDPARERTWSTRGKANRFGHFTSSDPPFFFDEPGEYWSLVRASHRDRRGTLWSGIQASTGVVAPLEPEVRLRPAGRQADGVSPAGHGDAGDRYEERLHHPDGILFQNASLLKAVRAPGLPLDPSDTLFVTVAHHDGLDIEPRFTVDVGDPRLAALLAEAGRTPAVALPRSFERPGQAWTYLQDVLMGGTSSHGLVWTRATPGRTTDLPVTPAARGTLHPLFAPPDDRLLDAWVSFGAVRPGFPALVGIVQRSGTPAFWTLNPNPFGRHLNAGQNGDLPGDVYRVQAGLVLKDLETGRNHYDLYAAAVAIVAGPRSASAILPPGARPLVLEGGRRHYLFLAADTHDALETGEMLGVGGMVFPNVPADVDWTVTKPSGETARMQGRADRRGIVRGAPPLPVDQAGAWDIQARVRWRDLAGGIPGTKDGRYFVCAIPPGSPPLLAADLPPVTRIDPLGAAVLPLRWPADLADVRIRFGTIMPGTVLEQGEARPEGASWTYAFSPAESAAAFPNLDTRFFGSGEPALADTVVFQFCLSARQGDREVHDSLRLVLRGDTLMNYRDL